MSGAAGGNGPARGGDGFCVAPISEPMPGAALGSNGESSASLLICGPIDGGVTKDCFGATSDPGAPSPRSSATLPGKPTSLTAPLVSIVGDGTGLRADALTEGICGEIESGGATALGGDCGGNAPPVNPIGIGPSGRGPLAAAKPPGGRSGAFGAACPVSAGGAARGLLAEAIWLGERGLAWAVTGPSGARMFGDGPNAAAMRSSGEAMADASGLKADCSASGTCPEALGIGGKFGVADPVRSIGGRIWGDPRAVAGGAERPAFAAIGPSGVCIANRWAASAIACGGVADWPAAENAPAIL